MPCSANSHEIHASVHPMCPHESHIYHDMKNYDIWSGYTRNKDPDLGVPAVCCRSHRGSHGLWCLPWRNECAVRRIHKLNYIPANQVNHSKLTVRYTIRDQKFTDYEMRYSRRHRQILVYPVSFLQDRMLHLPSNEKQHTDLQYPYSAYRIM